MRKLLLTIGTLCLGFTLTSCIGADNDTNSKTFDATSKINTYTRDKESGTRDGFFTAIGLKDAVKKDDLLKDVVTVSSNGDMITKIKNDEYAIGYISYASYLETEGLNALEFEGVKATEEKIVDGSYKLQRNFNYVIRNKEDMTELEYQAVYSFLKFQESQDGLAIIKANDGILTTKLNDAKPWKKIVEEDEIVKEFVSKTDAVELSVGGSTSVEKIAKELTKAFSELVKNVTFKTNHTGSGDAFKNTQGEGKDSANKLHIGYLSRELSSSENASEETHGTICKDGIVAVVNEANNVATNVTAKNLVDMYTKEIETWSELKA